MTKLRIVQLLAFTGLVLCARSPATAEELPEIWQVQAESQFQDPMAEPMTEPMTTPQPPTTPQTPSPFSTASSQSFSSGLRRPSSRMYDAPNMFGDLFSPAGKISFQTQVPLILFDPSGSATLDPAVLANVEQQLSQDATQQALMQFQQGEFDPSTFAIVLTLPDLSSAVIPPSSEFVVVGLQGMIDLQLAGGTRRTKIIENNHTLPQDRVFFAYNHFHNAIATDEFLLPARDAIGTTTSLDVITRRNVQSINRYTLGLEKTFEAGQSSVEFRMPLVGDLENSQGFDVVSEGGNIGNFAVILKRLFFTTDNFAVAAGLGINLPTGSDATGSLVGAQWRVNNEAVHYLPFFGVAGVPADAFFYQAFAQLDIAGTGNSVEIDDSFGQERIGRLNDQTLLFLDATGGAWLYRNPNSRVAGIASILELHYTTTLQDSDNLGVVAGGGSSDPAALTIPTPRSLLFFGNPNNRFDLLNGTVGLHTVLQNGTSLRVGGVFPLYQRDDKRLFDAEVQAFVNIPY